MSPEKLSEIRVMNEFPAECSWSIIAESDNENKFPMMLRRIGEGGVGVHLERTIACCGRGCGSDAQWFGRTNIFILVGVGKDLA